LLYLKSGGLYNSTFSDLLLTEKKRLLFRKKCYIVIVSLFIQRKVDQRKVEGWKPQYPLQNDLLFAEKIII